MNFLFRNIPALECSAQPVWWSSQCLRSKCSQLQTSRVPLICQRVGPLLPTCDKSIRQYLYGKKMKIWGREGLKHAKFKNTIFVKRTTKLCTIHSMKPPKTTKNHKSTSLAHITSVTRKVLHIMTIRHPWLQSFPETHTIE